MTYDDVITMLEEAGLPLAYDHFAEGESPDPPALIWTRWQMPSPPMPRS